MASPSIASVLRPFFILPRHAANNTGESVAAFFGPGFVAVVREMRLRHCMGIGGAVVMSSFSHGLTVFPNCLDTEMMATTFMTSSSHTVIFDMDFVDSSDGMRLSLMFACSYILI